MERGKFLERRLEMTDEEREQFKFEVAERAAMIAESQGEIPNIEGIAEEMTRYAWKERAQNKNEI
jgi:hypothetical protein